MAEVHSRLTGSGELDAFDQTIISAQVHLVAQQIFPIGDVITVVSKPRQTGRTSSIPQLGAQTFADISEGATGMTEVSAAIATTSRTVVQSVKGRDIFISLLAGETGTGPSEADIIDTLAKAYAKKRMSNLMALYTEAGSGANAFGSVGTAFTFASHFLVGLNRLQIGGVQGRKSLILAAPAVVEAGTEPQFTEWQKLGQAWLDADLTVDPAYLGLAPFGVRCYWSMDYSTGGSGGNISIMVAQPAIKLEEVMPFTLFRDGSEYGVGDSSMKYGARSIWGINGTRDTSTTNGGVVAITSSN